MGVLSHRSSHMTGCLGPLLVINGVIFPISRVINPVKSIYFRQFIGGHTASYPKMKGFDSAKPWGLQLVLQWFEISADS